MFSCMAVTFAAKETNGILTNIHTNYILYLYHILENLIPIRR